MGSKNRNIPNHKNNSKDVLLKQMQLDNLEKQINEKKEIAAEIETWLEMKHEKEAELETLKEAVEQYGAAKEIIEQKDEIIKQAEEKKQALENEIQIISSDLDDKKKQLEAFQTIIGVYEDANDIVINAKKIATNIQEKAEKDAAQKLEEYDEIISNANAEAKKIKDDASIEKTALLDEAKQLLNNAQTQADEKIAEAKKQYEDIIKEKDIILLEAKESADTIIKEAKEKVEQYFSGKQAEGESRKKAIIEAAQQEREMIITSAQNDAKTLADSIKTSAEDYAVKKREQADEQAEYIINQANSESAKIREKCEKEREETRVYCSNIIAKAEESANSIKEKMFAEMQTVREQLDNKLANAAILQGEYEAKLKELDRKTLMLDKREEAIEEEINERVEQQCEITKNRFDYLQEFANRINRENKTLYKYKEAEMEATARLVDKNTLDSMRGKLEELEAKGITVETADEFLAAKNSLKKAVKQIEDLKAKNSNLNMALLESNNSDEELTREKDKNKYYADVIKDLTDELDKTKIVTREEMLAPVKQAPAFMTKKDLDDDHSIENETEWLNHIQTQCAKSGLRFSKRQIYAYHTAQKIKDMSPLVVLAGVSGTGKSELPKNYAIHGGMNFLSIPVKPDWDSPASLFGYYNSIERRFEATELVRALYQMSKDDIHQQQMMMVLLDEMNLAHPEQYFADLLSKLETCRGMSEFAQYDILLGGGERPEHLEIGGNILWTGTMNEDETTKGLSDKVIDRSTLITFPRPTELYGRKQIEEIKPEFVLSKKKWNEWCGMVNCNEIIDNKLEEYRDTIQKINTQMSGLGRNLGHRVWQGIAKYIEHHPGVVYAKKNEDLEIALSKAFSDAIAFKVMPKLRGVETRGQNEDILRNIESILTTSASELVPDFNNAMSLTTELFQWCSADFMNKDDE